MKIEVKIDPELKEPVLTIVAPALTSDIAKIIAAAERIPEDHLVGFQDDKAGILKFEKIIRIIAQDKKVLAITNDGEFVLKYPLYEVETRLPGNFLRISNSEIINVDYLQHISMKFAGTLCLTLTNQDVTYCSRRYVKKIKEYFEI